MPALPDESSVHAAPAMLKGVESRLRGQLATAHRKPHPVARHRIDESGRIPSEEQAIDLLSAHVDSERAQDDRRSNQAGARETVRQARISGELASQQRLGIAKFAGRRLPRLDQTDVSEIARDRGHTDVAAATDV